MCFLCIPKVMLSRGLSWRDDTQLCSFPSASIHFPQEIKHFSKCGLDVLAVSPIVLRLYILICILKRAGRWKVKGRRRVSFFLHKYYLRRSKEDFFWAEQGLIYFANKEDCLGQEEAFFKFVFLFLLCLESGCCGWHEDIYMSCFVHSDNRQLMTSLGYNYHG